MPEIVNFKDLDPLFKKIVAAIVKGTGSDIRDYLFENRDETHNAVKLVRGDKINTNLRNFVVSDTVELKTFKRYAWEGRLIIDREHKITITICTKQTLEAIPKKKNRSCPHYLMSIVNIENQDVEPVYVQLSFVPEVTSFSQDEYQEDFKTIMEEEVNIGDGYKHLAIVYETAGTEVTYIAARLLDRDLGTGKEYSLEKFLKPDFVDLTAENNETNTKKNDVHTLVKVKKHEQSENESPAYSGLVTAKGQKEDKRA